MKNMKATDFDQPRPAFTKGWTETLKLKEALPVKTKDKIVRRVFVENDEESTEVMDDDSQDEVPDGKPIEEEDGESQFALDNDTRTNVMNGKILRMVESLDVIKAKIGDLCTAIIADPESALRKRKEVEENGDLKPKLLDLFAYLKYEDIKVQEVAMLSAFLVFKDICPGYRIRPSNSNEKEIQLKKETKKLRDFELSLLSSYQSFLKYLDKAASSFNNMKSNVIWDENTKLGLSALRCQCELLRSLLHFNFRSNLLESIVKYGAHWHKIISSLCCDTIKHIFQHDHEGEPSYEIVRIMTKVIQSCKYEVPEDYLRCLETTRLHVHADDSKLVRKQAKADRRKRKRTDEVELGLIEADATTNKSIARRFQADCLHEISLIYFRIIKLKIGFKLLPVALEGLGRITHLLDMDTVTDLLGILRKILEETAPPAPALIRLLCIHCALRTLSGPGKEIGMDDEIFLNGLRQLIWELPVEFSRWDLVFEAIDLSLLQRSESRNQIIISFIKSLLLLTPHLTSSNHYVSLALIHSILLRYPRIRSNLFIFKNKVHEDEDVVDDQAMKALRSETVAFEDTLEGDGTWVFTLLSHSYDVHSKSISKSVSCPNITPVPLKIQDAKYDVTRYCKALDQIFDLIPPLKQKKINGVHHHQHQKKSRK